MRQNLREGTTSGQSKHVGTGENSREVDISRNCGLLHHQNLWCIPYLRAKFKSIVLSCVSNEDRTLLPSRHVVGVRTRPEM